MFSVLLLSCIISLFSLSLASDPDLLDAPQSLQTLPAGSYVIPMHTALQKLVTTYTNWKGQTTTTVSFNLKAYGLVVNLLYADIPVRWAIRYDKVNPTDVDFVVYCQQVYPAGTYTAGMQQFSSGPFFIPPAYMVPPVGGGYSRADTVIRSFGQNVAVFLTLADATADVRYTLKFKPKVGVLDDVAATNPNNVKIHAQVLVNAGLTSDTHYAVINSNSDSVKADTCFTIITEPHWDADYTTSFNGNIRLFLDNGGNFLGQCEGVDVFENCNIESSSRYITYQNPLDPFVTPQSSNRCNGLLLTQGGLMTGVQDQLSEFGDKIVHYKASNTAFSQLETFVPITGWIESFDLKRGDDLRAQGKSTSEVNSNWIPGSGAHFVFSATDSFRGLDGFSFAAHGKMQQYVGKVGGNIFYLGGHDYSGGGTDREGGQRAFLNAMLHPAYRPSCSFDIPPQPEEEECVLFDPWAHGDYIFTPGCIPHITLDPGVGTNVKDCEKYIALPDGWEIVSMTTTSSPGVDPLYNPAETQIISDFGTYWKQTCIAGVAIGKTPNPTVTSPSPADTWSGYLTGTATATQCSSYTVDDSVIDANTGRRCYKVTCGTALLIRYPQHDISCNANNYGQYCDPATGSNYYTSTLSTTPNTIYINLAGTSPLPVPFSVPLVYQANVYAIIDLYNTVLTSTVKQAPSAARALGYVWDYGTYLARAVGWAYNTDKSNFLQQAALTYDQPTFANLAKNWSPTTYSGSSSGGGLDSPVIQTLIEALSFPNVGWAANTFKQIWVITKSVPRSASIPNLVSALSDNGPGAGVTVIFVLPSAPTPSNLATTYQNICNQVQRCAVVQSDYPDMFSTTNTATLKTRAQAFVGPIFTQSAKMVGRVTVVEVDDTYNFVTPPSNTWLTNDVANNPNWATVGGLSYSNTYQTNAASFVLPPNWVGPSSTPLMPLTINFKVVETGLTIKTIVSWNEPPKLLAPTLTYSFIDTDGVPFVVPVIDSIRSKLDPNVNLLKIQYLSKTFQNGQDWVSQMFINGGTSDGVAFPSTMPSAEYYNSLGLKIYPKAKPAGTMTLTYRISDGCLVSPVGTIVIQYTLSNQPPTAGPVTKYVNAGGAVAFDLRSVIADDLSPISALKIMILSVDFPSMGTLNSGTNPYTPIPTGNFGTVSTVAYQDLQYAATATASGSVVYRYRVIDEAGLSAESTITLVINKPPVLKVVPNTLTTTPGQTGSWTVTISDSPADSVTLNLEVRTVSSGAAASSIITSMTSTNPNSATSSVNLLTATPGTGIIATIPVPASGTINIPMSWLPMLTHPYGVTTTLSFSATDAAGLKSNIDSIVLGIPANIPPVWTLTEAITPTPSASSSTTSPSWSFTYPQNTGAITLYVTGTDANPADTEKLVYTVSQLPDPAKGTLYYIDATGAQKLVVAGTALPLSADKSTSTDGKTMYTLVYVPTASLATMTVAPSDLFRGFFTDPGAANSSTGVVNLVFTIVNKNPVCVSSLANTATQGNPLNIVVSGSDPDSNLKEIEITEIVLQTATAGATTTVTYSGANLALQAYPASAGGSATWTFVYTTNYYSSAVVDTIRYIVRDTSGAVSGICSATVTTTVVNQPPVVLGQTYTIDEGVLLSIPFAWNTGSATAPWYSDADGTQGGTTLTIKTLPSQGTLKNAGTNVVIGQASATYKGTSNPTFTFQAPAQILTPTTVTFTFTATDTHPSLPSKTSNTGTITIIMNPVDNPPVIDLVPTTIVTDENHLIASFTVTVTDVDSNAATVNMEDISIPWPGASYAGTNTITIKDASKTFVKAYPGDTTSATINEQVISLTKTSGSVFPVFYIEWNAAGPWLQSQSGFLRVQATADGKLSNTDDGKLQFNYQAPVNVAPTTSSVFIVVDEDSCVLSATCAASVWRSLSVSDTNFGDLEGDSIIVNLQSATLQGSLVVQSNTDRVSVPVPGSSLRTGYQSSVLSPYTFSFPLSFEPKLNYNSGESCSCTGGTSATTIGQCSGCTPMTIPFTVVDSKGDSASGSFSITIVVLPAADPPTSRSYVLDAVRNTALAVPIEGSDPDGDLKCIVFTKFNLQDTPVFQFTPAAAAAQTVVLNTEYCFTPTASGVFPFTFTTTSTNAVTDIYTFHVVDAGTRTSPDYTVTINVPRTPLNPTAVGGAVTTPEDTPVGIPITYTNSGAQNTYNDPDGTKPLTYLVVTELPPAATGILYGPNGEVVSVNTPIFTQDPTFNFVPATNYNGPSYFKWKSVDSETLQSTVVTTDITVTPIDDPPTITMTPLSLQQDRTVPGTFTVTVNDVDSLDIGVLLSNFDMPLGVDGVWSTFTYTNPTVTNVPSSDLVTTVTLTAFDTPRSFVLTWTPSASIPDDAVGTFTLYAANNPGVWDVRSVSSVTGTVSVLTANRPPYIVTDAAYPYSYAAVEGAWTEHTFHLIGSDPDDIHSDVLKITITQIPDGLTLTDKDGNVLSVGSVLFRDPTDPIDDKQTWAAATISVIPGVRFFGETSLTFTVTDLVGATSSPQVVPIVITEGNYPPETTDQILVVTEDYCTTSYCGVPSQYNILKDLVKATITTSDKNKGDAIWIQFETLPGQELVIGDPTTTTGAGIIAWFPFGNTDENYQQLSNPGPYSKGDNTMSNPSTWEFWFQPPQDKHSELSSAGAPNALLVGGSYYAPYSRLTYKVYDINPREVVTNYPDQATALAACADAYCPAAQTLCDDPAANAWICVQTPDLTGHQSPLHTLWIYVTPVNDPPDSNSLTYTINEDDYTAPGQYLEIPIPFVDVDSTSDQVGVKVLGITSGSKGTFYTKNGGMVHQAIDGTLETVITPGDRTLFYRPPPDAYSAPGTPLATLQFRVYDQASLTSPQYDVRIYVNSVPDAPVWITEEEITILEDSQALIILDGRDQRWSSVDDGNGYIFVTQVGKGSFQQCNVDGCVTLTNGSNLPFPLTEGRITYIPLPNENGLVNGDGSLKPDGTPTYFYTNFTFQLFVYPGATAYPASLAEVPATAIPLTINYKINVVPVNDPPELVPLWIPASEGINECDEDTFLRLRFTATDIDSDCNSLEADLLTLLDPFQSSLYSCATPTAPTCVTDPYMCLENPLCNSTVSGNCAKEESLVAEIGRIKKIGPAQWEISFVPYPNWNGNLKVSFMVWDNCSPDGRCDLFSPTKSVVVHVRPINDAPSIVKGSTSSLVEYYNDNRAKNSTTADFIAIPGQNSEDFTAVSLTRQEGSFEIFEGDSQDRRILEGQPLESKTVATVPVEPANPDPSKPLVTIHRLRTNVQDIDFFFSYSLVLEASLIHAVFVPQLFAPSAPCRFSHDFSVACEAEIRALNSFLGGAGFAIQIDTDADRAIGLFLLNDTGNVDKLDRPAAAGFTIVIYKDQEDAPLDPPIAAIVILPVIAAATAASIAAAWIFLGKSAQAYAGASFDAFTATAAGTGTISPIYKDLGKEVQSPLYTGQAANAGNIV